MPKSTIQAQDENLTSFLDGLTSRITDWVNSSHNNDIKTIDFIEEPKRREAADLALPVEGNGSEAVLDDVDNFLRQCVRTNKPEYTNTLWAGLNMAAFAGEVIATLTSQSMYTYELSPMATLIEKAIMYRMLLYAGFSEGFGTLTTGGSNGNMIGMLCARQNKYPSSAQTGFDGSRHCVFVSAEAHYSVLMAGNVIGIGHENVIKVACDSEGCMRVDLLEEEIEEAKAALLVPFCIIATSGTTVRGAFDPLRAISAIAKKENIWFHVDGAWGGSCLLSSNHRYLMDGIEEADSLCWDAHKMMGVPLICSAFLTKRKDVLGSICAHSSNAHYLFHEDTKDIDLGRFSLQCGRRNDSLKLWLAWREIGDNGWEKMVDSYCDLSDKLQLLVEEHPKLEMMSARKWANVCFRYVTQDRDQDCDLNALNINIRDKMMREGIHLVSRSDIGDSVVIRAVICNPLVDEAMLEKMVETVVRHGDEIVNGLEAKY